MNENAIRFLDPASPEFTLDQVAEIAHRFFKLEGDIKFLESERDLNFRITNNSGVSVILKISNAQETEALVDMQVKAMLHIKKHDPDFPIPNIINTVDGLPYDWCMDARGVRHMVRVISVIPGEILSERDRSLSVMQDVGSLVARSGLALQGFFHPSADHYLLWDIRTLADLTGFVNHIEDASLRRAVERDLDSTIRHILPALSSMRSQVIHNDANALNILCDTGSDTRENPTQLTGLIDFGDMMFAPLIQDLAVAAGSMTQISDSPIDNICHVAMGYDRILPLLDDEINILSNLAVARNIQETLIAAKRVADDPNTSDYNGGGVMYYANALDQMLSMGHDEMRRKIRKTCRFPVYCPKPDQGIDTEEQTKALLKRRNASLGKQLELSYDTPMHVVKSQGMWVYDSAGKKHLDCYNNVPHVGHCHPHVVRSVSRQLATMNSNTRYLYENVVEYAERLGATMPGDLSSCIFVNSGSEANDAALQVARHITGNRGAIIVESAYHGITETIMGLSPSIQPVFPPVLPDDVRTISDPNNTVEGYMESLDVALASLAADGKAPAAFMVDCSLSSNGIADIPKDYLPYIAEKVRAAGGLIIADEVQIGFGRSGTHMWGIEAQGVVPDIITLGKPMGNGIPIGAAVMTPDVHHRFTKDVDFFSTFGGNPVACAAANAVLDVMEQENLMEQAFHNGERLRKGIRNLSNRFPQIGSVNGQGLFNGVEIVKADGSQEPDPVMTDKIVNGMRKNGVLISTANPHSLKIRPPMAFRQHHADIFVETLEKVLSGLDS